MRMFAPRAELAELPHVGVVAAEPGHRQVPLEEARVPLGRGGRGEVSASASYAACSSTAAGCRHGASPRRPAAAGLRRCARPRRSVAPRRRSSSRDSRLRAIAAFAWRLAHWPARRASARLRRATYRFCMERGTYLWARAGSGGDCISGSRSHTIPAPRLAGGRVSGTPVVLIAFNRPEVTRRTFAAIREARPPRLFLVCDGPRADRPGDADEVRRGPGPCSATSTGRAMSTTASASGTWGSRPTSSWVSTTSSRRWSGLSCSRTTAWPTRRSSATPTSCSTGTPTTGGSGRLRATGSDCPRAFSTGRRYAFSAWASVWGWATWADRWHRHRELFPRDHTAPMETRRSESRRSRWTGSAGHARWSAALRRCGRRSDDVITHGWDKHWWLSIMSAGGVCATPSHQPGRERRLR